MAHAYSSSRLKSSVLLACIFGGAVTVLGASSICGQENMPGPMQPPPPAEHNVKRVVGVPEPEAPPSLPPAEIIARFSKKEELYQGTRPTFTYRKTIRVQEFGPDGKPSGEYAGTYDLMRSGDGTLYERAEAAPQSTLQYLQFEPEDAQKITRYPAFPVTPDQLSKYDLKYLNTEKVDEIDCYIFQVSPKTLERQHALFDGVIWVDQKYLEVVKTYGQWITDLGPLHPATLPFEMFETYRENVEGKYWFPDYSRSDGVFKMKDREVPIRVIIKWTNYKPFPPVTVPSTPAAAPTAGAPATTPNAPGSKP